MVAECRSSFGSQSDTWSRHLFQAPPALDVIAIQQQSRLSCCGRRAPAEEVLWPEFREFDAELRSYLQEVTLRMIREDVFADTSEAPEVDAPPALPQR